MSKTKLDDEIIRLKELCTHIDIIVGKFLFFFQLGNWAEDHCFCKVALSM